MSGLVFISVILINLPTVQNYLAHKAAGVLSRKLNTTVSVRNVRFHLLNAASLEGLYIQDQKGDTLLYAGAAEVSITDWFIFKANPTIHSLKLEDAFIYLNRAKNSSRWNYAFLLDALSSKRAPEQKDGSTVHFNLRKLSFREVHFYQKDEWVGTDMAGSAGSLILKAKAFNFKKKAIALQYLKGDRIVFGMLQYTGGRPAKVRKQGVDTIDTSPFNPDKWKVDLASLSLKNSRFYLDYPEKKAPPGLFDADHLNITGINIHAEDLNIRGDTIRADLKSLAARERCGLEIKKMRAKITVSPIISSCADLYLETGNSILTHYYAMHYRRFPDFNDYISKVNMEAHLENATIGIRDIAYFAPELADYQKISIRMSGDGYGTVDRLTGKNLVLHDGYSTLSGSISMNGLPDIDNTFIDFREGILKTSGPAAMLYAPALGSQTIANFKALKQVEFKGNFTGFITDFVAYGTFFTNLGNAKADINMKLPKGGMPHYSGALSVQDFDIGALFFQDYAGKTSFSAAIKGSGFKQKDVAWNVDGNISHIFIYGYDYKNISMKGKLQKRKFDGTLKVDDPNLILDFNGKVDFGRENPVYDFYARAGYFDTRALHISEERISGTAEMKLKLEGHDFNDFTGSARIYNLQLKRDSVRLNIDSVRLASNLTDSGNRQLILATNDLSARVYGRFSLTQLPRSFQLFLAYYLPEYIKTPARFTTDQEFQFDLHAEHPNDLLSLVDKSLKVNGPVHIHGALDMPRQKLNLVATLPYLRYRNFIFNDVAVNSSGDYSGLKLNLKANNISMAGDNIISTLDFQSDIFQDSASFQLLTTTPTSIGQARLNGTALAQNDSFYLRLTPSEFYLNKRKWQILKGNRLVFAPGYLSVDNLVLQNDRQEIMVNPPDRSLAPGKALVIFKNIDLSGLNPFFDAAGLNFKGLLDGTVAVESILKQPVFEFDLNTDAVRINDDTIGALALTGKYYFQNERLHLEKGSGIHYKEASATIYGDISFREDSAQEENASIQLEHARLNWLAPLLKDYVRQLSGTVSGNIDIGGSLPDFTTSGTIHLSHAGFTPDITGVHYEIRDGTIGVGNTMFDLGNLTVYDDEGHAGVLSGLITHYQLSNFFFRLQLNSENLEVVNLSSTEGDRFYGKVFAAVQARLNGPWSDLNMNVFATAQKNSHLFVPMGYGSDLGSYNYIRFKSYDTTAPKIKPYGQNKISFRLDAIVTPDLETSIILDPSTGDRIWAKGNGNIILDIPADGELKMNGNYIISQGTYDFSFKQLQVLNYKKQFTINSGSVIKWNGDITDADLDVSAYATVKARLYDLIQGEVLPPKEVTDAQVAQDVNVLLKMKGSLSEPDMKFNIQLVENRSVGTYAYQKLQRINNNEKQLLNQVASLLLLGQFVPPEGLNNTAISSGTINNMSELFASAASSQITNFANKLLGMEDLYVGLRYKNYSLSQSDVNSINYFNRNEAGLNLRKNFFNNRLVVEVGGVYDWGQAVNQDNFTAKLAGDFRIQYLLTEDGRIRFYIFRNSNYDALSLRNINRQGLGLSYRKSFNGLGDLFGSFHKTKTFQTEQAAPKLKEIQKADSL